MTITDKAEWLGRPQLQALLGMLCADGEEARIAGGAVRNALMGEPVTDIDIATTTLPDETERRARAAGFRTVPTGKEHGTITVIVAGQPYEVTTLRYDIETDGRRARVMFGRDWKRDAERRDFTINALYATACGQVIDLVGGLSDIETRTLRFIGDAEQRICEDYLRILRFFRFFAWYGKGRPDADGLRASGRLKGGLTRLSSERVWTELKKLLSASDPSRALLWMRQTGVLTAILPESEKWGIDAIHGLVPAERDLGWGADFLLRLEAILPPDESRLAELAARLRLSNAERQRLILWSQTKPIHSQTSEAALAKLAYRGDLQALADRLRLTLAQERWKAIQNHGQNDDALIDAGRYSRLLRVLGEWKKPIFPLTGNDLISLGARQGKALGKVMAALEDEWVESNFRTQRNILMERAVHLLRDS